MAIVGSFFDQQSTLCEATIDFHAFTIARS
jgi:hypothetical protein